MLHYHKTSGKISSFNHRTQNWLKGLFREVDDDSLFNTNHIPFTAIIRHFKYQELYWTAFIKIISMSYIYTWRVVTVPGTRTFTVFKYLWSLRNYMTNFIHLLSHISILLPFFKEDHNTHARLHDTSIGWCN